MKKKWMIVFIVILVISLLIASVVIIRKNREKSEVVNILQEMGKFQIYINNDENNLDKIEKELRNIKNVESVEFHSKEEALEDMKEKFSNDSYLLKQYEGESNIFPDSFIMTVKVENGKDINKDYFKNVENDINHIEGIKKITNSYNALTEVYNEYGISKLREYVQQLKNL